MAAIRSFRDLEVYRQALRAARRVFVLTKDFPKHEQYSLTDQVRRSSRAVGALIAEAWARRRYKKAFISKLIEALGETMETQSWLDHAKMCGYVSEETYQALDREWQHVGARIRRMIQRADDFCKADDR